MEFWSEISEAWCSSYWYIRDSTFAVGCMGETFDHRTETSVATRLLRSVAVALVNSCWILHFLKSKLSQCGSCDFYDFAIGRWFNHVSHVFRNCSSGLFRHDLRVAPWGKTKRCGLSSGAGTARRPSSWRRRPSTSWSHFLAHSWP